MSSFEFVFSLFALVLGFTLVEVLSGFVRTTKCIRVHTDGPVSVRVGWLTPLLAIFVLMDVTSYWDNVWTMREGIPVGLYTLLLGLVISGAYYFAASMVFPDDAPAWPELDRWFWLHKRQVLGPLIVVNAVFIALQTTLDPPDLSLLDLILAHGIYFGLLAVAFFDRRRMPVATALGLLIFAYLSLAGAQLVSQLG